MTFYLCNILNVKHKALFNNISDTVDEFTHLNDTNRLHFVFLMKHGQRQLSIFTWESYC